MRLFLYRGLVPLGLFALFICRPLAGQPAWWATHSVTSSQPGDDYAAANLGQLKYMADKAAQALNTDTVAGAGGAINTLIASWGQPAASGVVRDDYAVVKAGQLKYISKLFYQRLTLLQQDPGIPAQPYPWSAATTPADDWSVINIGQLKYVFSFTITAYDWAGDPDHDLMPDTWESSYLGGASATAGGDIETGGVGDGLSNLAEYLLHQAGANPSPASIATSTTAQNTGLVVYSP